MEVFAYCRVSRNDLTTANQKHAIERSGYKPTQVLEEQVSGSICAMERPVFSRMVENMKNGDVLVVLKIDRLGRDNIDVQRTIQMLTEKGITVVSLDLPTRNLASAEGKMMMQMFAVFAEFERARIAERTRDGLARAKAEGKTLGRPLATSTTEAVKECKSEGMTQQAASEKLGIGIATVKRHWNRA
ncbi:recombinase family protein [Klebsiella aerogenes]|uniref:recombinase family protein n=1 Tax=Klebsiella aerogenes TaxID=548 RepID=UPI000A3B4E28|nr:recombinase family protein [Klebsiella aerogenes]EKT8945015.1 recombinase family protein [Klebsiella aerogenes]EKV8595959.1 recombinase family protein [Klebsiella aerogenes]OUE90461.1 hypothetical protein AZZ82_000547 [Klebsiella aerogenes]